MRKFAPFVLAIVAIAAVLVAKLDADPTYFPWVQQYIDHFRTVIQPKYPSLFQASPANTQSPSMSKDLPSKTRTSKRRTRPQTRTRRNVAEEPAATN